MRAVVLVLMLLGAIMLTEAFVTHPRQRPGGSTFPTFPGQGPFNPRPRLPDAYNRGRRSAYVDESAYAASEFDPLQEQRVEEIDSDFYNIPDQ